MSMGVRGRFLSLLSFMQIVWCLLSKIGVLR
jgi:hypothetical protein